MAWMEAIAPTFDDFVLTTCCILFAVLLAVRLLHRLLRYKHDAIFFLLFVLLHVLYSSDLSHKHVLTRRVFVQCSYRFFAIVCANTNVVRFDMIVVQSETMITTWIHASIMVFLFINKKLCVCVCVPSQVVSHMVYYCGHARPPPSHHAI